MSKTRCQTKHCHLQICQDPFIFSKNLPLPIHGIILFFSFSVVFCRVYITEHSYVSVKTKVSTSAQEIVKIVAEKLQHSQEDLALVAVSFSGGKLFSTISVLRFPPPPILSLKRLAFSNVRIGLFSYGPAAG